MFSNFPKSFGFFFTATPVWKWEPEEHANDTATTSSVTQGTSGSKADDALQPPSMPGLRLVFKGYEWQPVARWLPTVDPAWDYHVEGDSNDIREREIREARERQQALQSGLMQQQRSAICTPEQHPTPPDIQAGSPPSTTSGPSNRT